MKLTAGDTRRGLHGMVRHQLQNRMKDIMPYVWQIGGLLVLLVAIIWGLCALASIYSVWASHKRGQADLAQAHNEQLIQVAKAKGRLEAAELNKQAEIIDAEAVAKSVDIIGKALHDNHGYLQWKWIHMMEERDSGDTIYVPTEAGLPILEAGKRARSDV